MAISGNMIGNLLGRHLKFDIGDQNYNSVTGRGYVFSADTRIGFFVDYNQTDGPAYAVSLSGALTNTEKAARKLAADQFVNLTTTTGPANYTFPTSSTSYTSTSSIFYKAVDTNVIDFDSSSISSVFAQKGLGKADFSNTAMLLETWIQGVLDNAATADVSATSGIRGFINGNTSPMVFKLWTELIPVSPSTSTFTAPTNPTVMGEKSEVLLVWAPSQLSPGQRNMFIDGAGGFDTLSLNFKADSGVNANFSNLTDQTVIYGSGLSAITFKVKNFEGIDLTDFDDIFLGSSFDNSVFPLNGNDSINGGGTWTSGNSSDRDWVQYTVSTTSITLSTNSSGIMKVKKNGFNVDTLTNIEAIGGTFFIDRMSGGSGNFNQIFAGNKGGDIIDGGEGVDDRVWHREDPSGVVLNLSDKTVNPKAVTQLVKSIQKYAGADGFGSLLAMKDALEDLEMPSVTKVLSNRALDGWGDVDILSNIEAAQGSSFDDQLYGSNARNILSGGDGFDFIVGNGGDDHIIGGYGHDVLYGGLGLDWIVMDELNWGNLTPPTTGVYNRYNRDFDQNGNMVVYQSVSESTTSKADVLDGFVLGKDIIDLTNMDANTKRSGNQEFSDVLVTSWPSPPKAGVLRISEFTGLTGATSAGGPKPGQQDFHNATVSISTNINTYRLPYLLLEGDVNGDGVADFAVKLLGITLLSAQQTVNGLSDSILY
jgi:hypothetical protein